ncbi:MAG: DUF4255 domain-containing protein [Candidatus Hamiltonella defensa (Ceratovacuna japonica)]
MINSLNDTLAALLEQELALKTAGIQMVFAAPDSRFFQKVTPPLIAIFLYDIRENRTLRMSEPVKPHKNPDDTFTLLRSPVPVDYSYLITAWGSSDGSDTKPDKDQHDMLSRVLHALLRYPVWPAALLKGQLEATPLPRACVAQPGHLNNMAEFWSAMGGPPRAVLHYTVTAPVSAHAPINDFPAVKHITRDVIHKPGEQ